MSFSLNISQFRPAFGIRIVANSNTASFSDVRESASTVIGVIGPRGRDGATAGGYQQVFSSASNSWVVNHNLNRYPSSVTILSPGGSEVEAEISHVSVNQLIVSFNVPFAGRVVIG